jgi:hypothetical protein
MSELYTEKLHVTFHPGTFTDELSLSRKYTLTHSDFTGELFLSIGAEYDRKQISGFYTRLMRDEVLAEYKKDGQELSLHVYCHVSGGVVFGSAGMRNAILHQHMRMVLEAFRQGDGKLIDAHPELNEAKVWVHFMSNHPKYNRIEDWGLIQTYK